MASLDIKVTGDSFVVESNIHFPTDLNLLWDSVRKCIETIGYFRGQKINLTNWREWKDWLKKVRVSYRWASEIHRKKGADYTNRLVESVNSYLEICSLLAIKVQEALLELTVTEIITRNLTAIEEKKVKALRWYYKLLEKHIDLVHRRIILGERIPAGEKLFSIFEPHVEWNSKGKAGKAVELGHNVLVQWFVGKSSSSTPKFLDFTTD